MSRAPCRWHGAGSDRPQQVVCPTRRWLGESVLLLSGPPTCLRSFTPLSLRKDEQREAENRAEYRAPVRPTRSVRSLGNLSSQR